MQYLICKKVVSSFVGHGEDIYEGMVVGINTRDKDLVINVDER